MSTTTADVTLADLAARLTRLEDVRAIEQLKYRYANHCDNHYDPDGIAALFVEDGRWVVDGEGGTMTGHDEIKAHFRALSDKISWALHYMIAPQIDLAEDGQSATGRFYLLCLCTIENARTPREGPGDPHHQLHRPVRQTRRHLVLPGTARAHPPGVQLGPGVGRTALPGLTPRGAHEPDRGAGRTCGGTGDRTLRPPGDGARGTSASSERCLDIFRCAVGYSPA